MLPPETLGGLLYWGQAARDGAVVGRTIEGLLAYQGRFGAEPPPVMTPAFSGAESVIAAPEYVAAWRRPEMTAFARTRIARGGLSGIPPEIIAEIQAENSR